MSSIIRGAALVASLVVVPVAVADPECVSGVCVEWTASQGASPPDIDHVYKDGRHEIFISDLGHQQTQFTYDFHITATVSNADIGLLRFRAGGATIVNVHIYGDSGNFRDVLEIRHDISGGGAISGTYYLKELDITRDLGDVSIQGALGETIAVVGGDLVGNLSVTQGNGENSGIVHKLDIDGDMLGDLAASTIGSLSVGGDIGAPLSPVSIDVNQDMGAVRGGGTIFAEITIGGDLGRFETGCGGSHGGDFEGSLSMDAIAGISPFEDEGIYIHNHFKGMIELSDPLTFPIHIGASLATNSIISLPSGGLQDQIIVNQRDESGVWAGNVLIDETALSNQPHYTNTAVSIGGGAAGLAPFTHHGTSCSPAHGAVVFGRGIDIFDPELECIDIFKKAKVRFYGPVELVGAAPHVEVLVKVGESYVDAGFTVVTSIVSDTGEREVLVKRENDEPWPVGEYCIVPLEGKMTSKGVGEGDVDVDMFVYEFTLSEDGCMEMLLGGFDMNSDQALCGGDIAMWTASPVDLNGDESVCAEDLVLLMEAIDLYDSLN